jgi:hypothetical protein
MSSNSTGKVMEYNSSIKEAVGQCAEGLSQCLEIPELEDDWVEDALGSIEDLILSNGLHVSLGASLEVRIASGSEDRRGNPRMFGGDWCHHCQVSDAASSTTTFL